VALNDEKTVVQEIGDGRDWLLFDGERLTVWKYLRRFLFDDDRMNTFVGKLSRRRAKPPPACEGIEKRRELPDPGRADERSGPVDAAHSGRSAGGIRRLCHCSEPRQIFPEPRLQRHPRVEGNGYVHFSEGDYDYYLEKRNARLAAAAPQSVVPAKREGSAKPKSTKLKWKEAKELETIEQDISRAEEEVRRIEGISRRRISTKRTGIVPHNWQRISPLPGDR